MNNNGVEAYVIPIQSPLVAPLQQCWVPEGIEGDVHFSDEEMKKIAYGVSEDSDDD
jgi:hypothetical protein